MKIYGRTLWKYGMLFSLWFNLVVIASLYLAPELLAQDYPAAIQQRAQLPVQTSMTPVLVLAVALWGGLLVLIGLANREINREHTFRFLNTWLTLLLALEIMSISDVLIADWLVFCTINPDFLILPGTAGMPEYKDYWYHVEEFFRPVGHISMIVISLFAAFVYNLGKVFGRNPKAAAAS